MSYKENIDEKDLLDDIFEGRNKEYGAYELRQKQTKRVIAAFLVATLLFVSFISTLFFTMKGKKKEPVKITKVELKKLDKPKDKPKEEIIEIKEVKKQEKQKAVVDVVKNVPPVVVKAKTVKEEIPPTEALDDKKTSSVTATGDPNAQIKKDAEIDKVEQEGDKTDYSQTFTSVEKMPEPPGGINAFRKKVGDTFKTPEVEENMTASVIARFVVMEDGTLSDIKILKETPANLGLGKEAIRVLSKLPKWTPGVMNGRNVKVYYTLPIQIQIIGSE